MFKIDFFVCEDCICVLFYIRLFAFKTQVSQTAVELVGLSKSVYTSAHCLQITLLASNVQLSCNHYAAHISGPVEVFLCITTDGIQVESR